jgi:hypothetical protein
LDVKNANSALDAAIRIGEQAVDLSLTMTYRERQVKWRLYKLRYLIRKSKTAEAEALLEELIKFLNTGVADMTQGPTIAWVHALHQVTGLFALRGARMTDEDKAKAMTILRQVVTEMDDDKNWVQFQSGGRPRQERGGETKGDKLGGGPDSGSS